MHASHPLIPFQTEASVAFLATFIVLYAITPALAALWRRHFIKGMQLSRVIESDISMVSLFSTPPRVLTDIPSTHPLAGRRRRAPLPTPHVGRRLPPLLPPLADRAYHLQDLNLIKPERALFHPQAVPPSFGPTLATRDRHPGRDHPRPFPIEETYSRVRFCLCRRRYSNAVHEPVSLLQGGDVLREWRGERCLGEVRAEDCTNVDQLFFQ